MAQGGFGRTFLGRDRDLPTSPHCVIKQLYLQQTSPGIRKKAIALFQQEASLLQQLGTHPQIPTLLAHFEQDEQLYLVQEYIEGEMPSPAMWQQSGNPEAQTWKLLKDLLPVLQFVSDRNIIHRDIKPSNIILRYSDSKFVLIDFGVSRLLTDTALMGGATTVGTPGYMAPEQLHGKVLPASDLYALGVTCLHLLTGVEPDRLYDAIAERWTWREHLPPNLKISAQLSKILNALVQPSLKQRSSSAAAVLREIGVFPVAPPPSIPPTPAPNPDLITTELSPSQKPQTRASRDLEATILCDYSALKQHLRRQHWREADEETQRILYALTGKRPSEYLCSDDLERIPCAEIKMLDLLWEQASKGRFGFKVQAQIYQSVGRQYNLFCDRVGWPNHQSPSEFKSVNYSLRAPVGHLPFRRWSGGYTWWKHLDYMTEKLIQCNIIADER
nr:serine/threonine-protein kinase [Oscillatoria sp. FACHB-1406]